jgi:hypothetical protein
MLMPASDLSGDFIAQGLFTHGAAAFLSSLYCVRKDGEMRPSYRKLGYAPGSDERHLLAGSRRSIGASERLF